MILLNTQGVTLDENHKVDSLYDSNLITLIKIKIDSDEELTGLTLEILIDQKNGFSWIIKNGLFYVISVNLFMKIKQNTDKSPM